MAGAGQPEAATSVYREIAEQIPAPPRVRDPDFNDRSNFGISLADLPRKMTAPGVVSGALCG
jgi:hypothetical protein